MNIKISTSLKKYLPIFEKSRRHNFVTLGIHRLSLKKEKLLNETTIYINAKFKQFLKYINYIAIDFIDLIFLEK